MWKNRTFTTFPSPLAFMFESLKENYILILFIYITTPPSTIQSLYTCVDYFHSSIRTFITYFSLFSVPVGLKVCKTFFFWRKWILIMNLKQNYTKSMDSNALKSLYLSWRDIYDFLTLDDYKISKALFLRTRTRCSWKKCIMKEDERRVISPYFLFRFTLLECVFLIFFSNDYSNKHNKNIHKGMNYLKRKFSL